jgi:hypothetical protein
VEVQTTAWLHHSDGGCVAQTIDISQGGIKIRCRTTLQPPADLTVALRGMPDAPALLRWPCDDVYGLVFKESLPLKTLVKWVRELQTPPRTLNLKGKAA